MMFNIGDKVRLIRKYDKSNPERSSDVWLASLDIKENIIYEVEKTVMLDIWMSLKNQRTNQGTIIYVMASDFELVQPKSGFVINLNDW